MFGIPLEALCEVTERYPPRRKAWCTVSEPTLLVVGPGGDGQAPPRPGSTEIVTDENMSHNCVGSRRRRPVGALSTAGAPRIAIHPKIMVSVMKTAPTRNV